MPAHATPVQLLAELRRLSRQRRPVPVADVAPLLTGLLGACTALELGERQHGIAVRLSGAGAVTLSCFVHRAPAATLTPAELAVAQALCAGRTRAQIATLRGVSPDTVKSQIRQIFRKLDVESRIDLVRLIGP